MIFTEKRITLKNHKTAILRSPKIEDAEELLNNIIASSGETEFLTNYPEEYTMGVEGETAWIRSHLESPDSLVICCEMEGKIVASCDLRFNSKIKTSHRAALGITVRRAYWGLGIGSAMFETMIAAAKERGVEIMELEFLEGNNRAKHLYEKFGFRIASYRPNAFRLKDGTMLGEFYMQKYL